MSTWTLNLDLYRQRFEGGVHNMEDGGSGLFVTKNYVKKFVDRVKWVYSTSMSDPRSHHTKWSRGRTGSLSGISWTLLERPCHTSLVWFLPRSRRGDGSRCTGVVRAGSTRERV